MTVKELIEELKDVNPDLPIVLRDWAEGYCESQECNTVEIHPDGVVLDI